jgi:hypothetical protein
MIITKFHVLTSSSHIFFKIHAAHFFFFYSETAREAPAVVALLNNEKVKEYCKARKYSEREQGTETIQAPHTMILLIYLVDYCNSL